MAFLMTSTGVFKFENGVASVDGVVIELSARRLPIFQALCESQYKAISKEALYLKVFPEHAGMEISKDRYKLLESHITKLRGQINAAVEGRFYGWMIDSIAEGYMNLSRPLGTGTLKFHGLTLDMASGVIIRHDLMKKNERVSVPHNLGYTQKRVIVYLAANRGREVSHKELFDFIYRDYPLLGIDANSDGWESRLSGLLSTTRMKLDSIEMGASAFIETCPGAYRFALSPDLMKTRNADAVKVHEEDFDEEDPDAILFGDLTISPNSRTVFSSDPPPDLLDRSAVLTPPEWALFNILRDPNNYNRYLHAAEIFKLKTGKDHRGYNAAEIVGWATSLAEKINRILKHPFIHVEPLAFSVAAGITKPPLPVEIAKTNVRAGNAKPFDGGKVISYGDLEMDTSCHVIRNRNKRDEVFILDKVPGKLLQHLLENTESPLDINTVVSAIDSSFETLRSGGLIKDLDVALAKLGFKGIIYTTASTSHIMLDKRPLPVLGEQARAVTVRSENKSSKGTLLHLLPWHREIIRIMKAAGGQVCYDALDKEQAPVVKTHTGHIKLSEASPEAFTSIMNGLAKKLATLSGSPTAVMRNFSGCYRFGPDINFHL